MRCQCSRRSGGNVIAQDFQHFARTTSVPAENHRSGFMRHPPDVVYTVNVPGVDGVRLPALRAHRLFSCASKGIHRFILLLFENFDRALSAGDDRAQIDDDSSGEEAENELQILHNEELLLCVCT